MSKARIDKSTLERIAAVEVPVAGQLGVIVESVAHGEVGLRVPYRDDFVRPGGTIAGPVMMALADFAVYAAVLSLIGRVELAVTTSFNINFLRRPPPSDLCAVARILKLGRRLAVGEVELRAGEEPRLVAHATCTYSIPPVPRIG